VAEHEPRDIWRDVRRKVLDTLSVAVPTMPFEMRVIIAEDAARDVSDYATQRDDGTWPLDPRPTEQWVTAPDGEEFLAGACQGHSACPVDRHEHGCFADDGTNCDHPEDHEPTEQEQP
jgi:hypothetical protein